MEHTTTGEPNPVDRQGLCLLSLDGGGVRGLSTLFILKGIMARLNHKRKETGLPSAKPCQVFDLIGGTSTGGLIAIMLGRLEMDVDECISTGNVKAQFDSKKLRSAVEQAINQSQSGASPMDRFNDGQSRGCRVFVCAAAKETSDITRLRSYDLPGKASIEATILDAALATSAATGFFDPVRIGARQFVDGALRANNPVEQVEREASDIWCADTAELMPQVKCFVSVGTGHPGTKAIEDKMVKLLSKTLVGMVTETEQTEARFIARWRQYYDLKRYFRFNVDHGLEGVGLDEYHQQGTMEAATESYLDHIAQITRVRDCVLNLSQKQNGTPTTFLSVIREYSIRLLSKQTNSHEPCWTVPFEKNLRFVGRASLLDRLEAVLFAKEQPSKIALFGLGGVGKTQVALELAYRTREKYTRCCVIWIPTNNTARLRQAYIDAAEQLGIHVTDEKSDVKKLVQRHLSQDSAGRWLLIYDNADDFDMWIPGTGSQDKRPGLLGCVPRSNQGCVVFTTRNKKLALRLSSGGLREEVTQMDDDTALQLLYGRLNQKVPERHEEGQALIKELCHLPLAIVQAAAYIDANTSSVKKYLDLLNEQEEHVVELLSEEFGDEGSYGTVKDPVATTWLISFAQIRRSDPVAVEYLSLMSCFDPKAVPQSLLPPGKSHKEKIDALGTLTAYAFVSVQPVTDFLDMHRLVHLAMRNWLKQDEKTFSLWMHKAVTREAESCFLHVTETWKTELGEDHPFTLTSMAILAILYRDQGRWDEAERLEVQVMETFKTKLGEDHLSTLISIVCLASTYGNQGLWDEAERLEVQVIETSKRKLGEDHPSTLTSMAHLALTYGNQGRWDEAERLEVQGRWDEAERLEVQVMETFKTKLGEDHLSTLTSIANLASTYGNQGRWDEAERLEVQVAETCKTKLGADHPYTLINMSSLAATYMVQGRWEEAERLEVQVMETSKRKLGADHPRTLVMMASRGQTSGMGSSHLTARILYAT
ncbi:protein kinase subdomain-containing protein [Cordyceps javanica]|uniref:Protein kinase subdomain-containing protein n=1 Tax=Cordyceps javanica TaxID=43265 RepID=A0A545URW0_9HYPO|nr:protein kinase subdomain-containing protein [Cordyceps javanica]